MTAYLDATVILRVVLGQRGALREWRRIRRGVASALVEVECLRTLDRLRLLRRIGDAELSSRREAVLRVLARSEVVEIGRAVLQRAAQPLPTALGTLDAIHLATALHWREATRTELALATHDEALGVAARAHALRVLGA
jgi:predicted nucleic acid-binding protein